MTKDKAVYEAMTTTIQRIEALPGQRLLVVSDIHGHYDWLVQLLKKLEYGADDILVILGDLIDKGPESLRVVRYVMELSRRQPVYVSMGNVDLARVQMLLDDTPEAGEAFARFLSWVTEFWGVSFFQDMLSELGIGLQQITAENAQEYMQRLREHFREELEFLRSLPTILTAGRYLFVHGGVPTDILSALEGTDAVPYLKNDAFLEKGYRFETYTVVTGHWPTCLYRQAYEDVSPLFEAERGILCIDGGCGLKVSGQLNGILIPGCMAETEEITWRSVDAFPTVRAIAAQEERPAEVHIKFKDSRVELLAEKEGWKLVRQVSSGKTSEVPAEWLKRWSDGYLHCEDYCDRLLPVQAGERLSMVLEAGKRRYVKAENGQIGWYDGPAEPVQTKLRLAEGAPSDVAWRRERELAVYALLERLGIPFERIDHCEANTMEACQAIDEALDAVICKNLFLCNQQRTRFYLLMMPGDKKFKTKDLSKQIGSSRLSFAEAVHMERLLHISPGSVSVMGLMNDTENQVQLLMDREILEGERLGCHPCVNTSSIRLALPDLLEKFLPAVHHAPLLVEL